MGCPSRGDVKKAFNLSRDISLYGKQATVAVGDLYEGKVISYEQKELYVSYLRQIQEKGEAFFNQVDALAKVYKTKLPDEEIGALDIFFNQEIIAPLVAILVDAGKLSKDKAQAVFAAVAVLKQAILFIANSFGKSNSNAVSFTFYKENQLYV